MATHLKRTPTAHLPSLTLNQGSRRAHWENPGSGLSVLEIFHVSDPQRFRGLADSAHPMAPPYHWHWYQHEYFRIRKGRFIFTLEGERMVRTAADGVVHIPPTARHTFVPDAESEGECEMEISAAPEETGLSEQFFRNVYCYLDDCEEQKVAPSLPQLLIFLDSAEVSLAFPGPAKLMQWVSWAFGVVVGRWFGGYVLGYKASYPEYYDPKMTKRA